MQKNIALTGHIVDHLNTVVSQTLWASLSDEDKQIFSEVMLEAAERATKIVEEREAALVDKFVSVVRATIKGTVIVALVQGGLGAATFWIVGLPAALLWGLLMALTSLLPALGPAIVWVPVAVYLLATTAIWQVVRAS